MWDELDLLYFLGYALWNYVLTPYYFTWPDMVVRELDATDLEVIYPEGFHTHWASVEKLAPRAICFSPSKSVRQPMPRRSSVSPHE